MTLSVPFMKILKKILILNTYCIFFSVFIYTKMHSHDIYINNMICAIHIICVCVCVCTYLTMFKKYRKTNKKSM